MGAPESGNSPSKLTDEGKSGRFTVEHLTVCAKLVIMVGITIAAFRLYSQTTERKPETDRLEEAWDRQMGWETGKPVKSITVKEAHHRGVAPGDILYQPTDDSPGNAADTHQLVSSSSADLPPQEAARRARDEQRRGEVLDIPNRNRSLRDDSNRVRIRHRNDE